LKQQEKLTEESDALLNKIAKLEEDAIQKRSENEKLNLSCTNLKQSVGEKEDHIKTLENKFETLLMKHENDLKELRDEQDKKIGVLELEKLASENRLKETLKESENELQSKNKDLKKRCSELQQKVEKKELELKVVKRDLQTKNVQLRAQNQTLQENIVQNNLNLEKQINLCAEAEGKYAKLGKKLVLNTHKIKQLEAEKKKNF